MRLHTLVSIRASDASTFAASLTKAGITVEDTGERVTTDDGLDGEHVLSIVIPAAVSEGAGAMLFAHR